MPTNWSRCCSRGRGHGAGTGPVAGHGPSAELLQVPTRFIQPVHGRPWIRPRPLLWLQLPPSAWTAAAGCPAQIDGRVFTSNKRLMGPAIAGHSMAMLMAIAARLPAYQRGQAQSHWDGLRQRGGFGELRARPCWWWAWASAPRWPGAPRPGNAGDRPNSSREGRLRGLRGPGGRVAQVGGPGGRGGQRPALTAATTGVFDAAFSRRSNRARFLSAWGAAPAIDTDALLAPCSRGRLYGQGLDVTDPEPPADSKLWQMENVIITPTCPVPVPTAGGGWR